jgi:hypothetical protein
VILVSESTWALADAEGTHASAPRRFFIPPRAHREGLAVGRNAKLLFEFAPRAVDGIVHDGERMWVEVIGRHPDGTYAGRLSNDPQVLTELSYGDPIEFSPSHVIAIEYSAEELGYDPRATAVIDAKIVIDDCPPTYVVLAQPPGSDEPLWFAGIEHGPPADRRMIPLGDLTDRWPELAVAFASTKGYWERSADASYHRASPPTGA